MGFVALTGTTPAAVTVFIRKSQPIVHVFPFQWKGDKGIMHLGNAIS